MREDEKRLGLPSQRPINRSNPKTDRRSGTDPRKDVDIDRPSAIQRMHTDTSHAAEELKPTFVRRYRHCAGNPREGNCLAVVSDRTGVGINSGTRSHTSNASARAEATVGRLIVSMWSLSGKQTLLPAAGVVPMPIQRRIAEAVSSSNFHRTGGPIAAQNATLTSESGSLQDLIMPRTPTSRWQSSSKKTERFFDCHGNARP